MIENITTLLGQILKIHPDNNNITCEFFNTSILLGCRPILEEYGSEIEYIQE